MKIQNLVKKALFVGIIALSITSCKKDKCADTVCPTGYICDEGVCITDPSVTPETNYIVKSGVITEDETWNSDNIYELAGKVIVADGTTLTINPGTIIKGRQGSGSLASALVIARGGVLMAEGTESNPIVFTSTLDNIKKGETMGSNLDENDHSKWGGLIILGNAKISAKIGDTEAQIEGIPADESYGRYGGTNDADNSGVIKYVSIRHGGALIGEGNEINGLTLGGVGSGTTIHHVEVVANLDDGIECFGGTVNIDYALVAYQGDDGFDIDQNYAGTFNHSMVVYNNNGDNFLEIDGPENSTYSNGLFTIKNCSFVSKTNDGLVNLKSKAQGLVKDCHFDGLTKFKLSASWTDNCTVIKTDAYDRFISSQLQLENNNTNAIIQVYTKSEDESVDPFESCPIPSSYNTEAEQIYNGAGNSTSSSATVVDGSEFDWTWTSKNGKL